jgi:hypothetical protein
MEIDRGNLLKNEFGIPLRCVDCPLVAPALDDVRALETAYMFVKQAIDMYPTGELEEIAEDIGLQHDISLRLTVKTAKLGMLIGRTEGCTGAILAQAVLPDVGHIDTIVCGS